jgi:hypothetical protein
MQAYIYQAALFCEECAAEIRNEITVPDGMDPDNESTWDSDDYPKGPYPDGGGEADTPHHCDTCGLFLENPLTDDGNAYVREAVLAHIEHGEGFQPVIEQWMAHYDYLAPWEEATP